MREWVDGWVVDDCRWFVLSMGKDNGFISLPSKWQIIDLASKVSLVDSTSRKGHFKMKIKD